MNEQELMGVLYILYGITWAVMLFLVLSILASMRLSGIISQREEEVAEAERAKALEISQCLQKSQGERNETN